MTTVVRVCEATYDATLVVKEGIQVLVSWCSTLVVWVGGWSLFCCLHSTVGGCGRCEGVKLVSR